MKITLNQKSALFSAFVVSLFIILCLLFLFLFVNFFFKRLTNDNNSFELSPDELLNEQWTQIKVILFSVRSKTLILKMLNFKKGESYSFKSKQALLFTNTSI